MLYPMKILTFSPRLESGFLRFGKVETQPTAPFCYWSEIVRSGGDMILRHVLCYNGPRSHVRVGSDSDVPNYQRPKCYHGKIVDHRGLLDLLIPWNARLSVCMEQHSENTAIFADL